MIVGAAILGVFIIVLGFATSSPEAPPTQALLFGGMLLIAAAYGRVWRWHGAAAAVVIAFLAAIGWAEAVINALRAIKQGQEVAALLAAQVAAFIASTGYFFYGMRTLLAELRRRRMEAQLAESSQDEE